MAPNGTPDHNGIVRNDMQRMHTHDIEVGVADALQRHVTRHVVPPPLVSERRVRFENSRPRLLRELAAEATGVFFYVFSGIGATAVLTLNTGEGLAAASYFGNILQVGFAFALGIAFAIITCAQVSGGHFNPAITLSLAVWQGFPWKKVPLYILAQIFGSFMAGLLLMGCYWPEISAFRDANIAAHGTAVFNGGAASILCAFPNATQNNLGYLFFQEFIVDAFIGVIIWACLDPANPFVSPVSVPFTIGLAYAAMIWGYAPNTLSTNLARDLGTRFVATIFFGTQSFTYKNYCWIALLVNIPATLLATSFYEFLIRDSLMKIAKGHGEYEHGEDGLHRFLTKDDREMEVGISSALRSKGEGISKREVR